MTRGPPRYPSLRGSWRLGSKDGGKNPSSRPSRSQVRHSHQVWRPRKICMRRPALSIVTRCMPHRNISPLQGKAAIHPRPCRGESQSQDCSYWEYGLPIFRHRRYPCGTVEEERLNDCPTLRGSCSSLLSSDADRRRYRPGERQSGGKGALTPFTTNTGRRIDADARTKWLRACGNEMAAGIRESELSHAVTTSVDGDGEWRRLSQYWLNILS